jgi:hypothetical protein
MSKMDDAKKVGAGAEIGSTAAATVGFNVRWTY